MIIAQLEKLLNRTAGRRPREAIGERSPVRNSFLIISRLSAAVSFDDAPFITIYFPERALVPHWTLERSSAPRSLDRNRETRNKEYYLRGLISTLSR